jgi:hypothetical protein
MKDLIIDRSTWRTGGNELELVSKYGMTKLINHQGNKCCLGFYCQQIGEIPRDLLIDVAGPKDIFCRSFSSIEPLVQIGVDGMPLYNTEFTRNAIDINDDPNLKAEERESFIIHHFKNIDVNVIFENNYK